MKKTGVLCVALIAIMAIGALAVNSRQFASPALAVPTPCGEVDASHLLDGGNNTVVNGSSVTLSVRNITSQMVLVNETDWTTSNRTVQLNIDFLALSCIGIYDNGVFVMSVPVTPSTDWQNVRPVFDLTTVGMHQITIVGHDLQGNPLDENLASEIVYDPNFEVPLTGVLQIGELAIARVDLITIVSSLIAACGVFALLVVLKNRKQEERRARRR